MSSDPTITESRWLQIKELFFEALDLPAREREAFLASRCGGDQELRATAARMLHQHLRDVEGFEEDPPHPSYPKRFGPYKVISLVATTLTTIVLKAVRDDGQFEQTVAIKLIQPAALSPNALARMDSERRILATLNHPSICRLLDAGQLATGQHYLILEWIEGELLLDHVRSLDLRARLLLFRDICSVIEAAHRLLIVHRDLKPAHILITPQQHIKILDFGIAKILPSPNEADSLLTQYGQTPLTPAYASPEQWRAEPATASFDVFSLGVLLHELVAGSHPFGPSPALPHEWASRILSGVHHVDSRLPRSLRAIITMAIDSNPLRRYPSVEALRRDIENYLEVKPLLARPDHRFHHLTLWVSRNRKYLVPSLLCLAFAMFEAQQMWSRREVQLQRAAVAQQVARDLILKTFESLVGTGIPAATRRQILNAAIQQLDLWLASDPPEAQRKEIASLYGLIGAHLGESFTDNLEDFAAAERCVRRGVDLWEQIPSATAAERYNARTLLADILFSHSKWQEASAEYSKVAAQFLKLPAARTLSGKMFASVLDSMQGDILLALGKPHEALSIQKEVLALRLEVHRISGGIVENNYTSYNLANVHLSLAQTYQALRQLDQAIQHARSAIDFYKQNVKSEKYPRELATSQMLLGDLLTSQGRTAAARLALQEAEKTAALMVSQDPGGPSRIKILNQIRQRLKQL